MWRGKGESTQDTKEGKVTKKWRDNSVVNE